MAKLHQVEEKVYECFYEFLQKSINSTLNALDIAASGKFSVKETNTMKSITDVIVGTVLERIPFAGSTFAKLYSSLREKQRVDFAK